jgi:hypothetical protein
MPSLADVRAIAGGLPDTVEEATGMHGWTGWKVRGKGYVWERPLRDRDIADLEGLGERVPSGEIVAVRVPREEKEAVLASSAGVFDIPHFQGYPAVLIELERADLEELRELISDAWILQAPKRLSKAWLAAREARG